MDWVIHLSFPSLWRFIAATAVASEGIMVLLLRVYRSLCCAVLCTTLLTMRMIAAGHGSDSLSSALPVSFYPLLPELGLSQSSVYAVMQDKKGFLWMGAHDQWH